jgi:hypothetical protein
LLYLRQDGFKDEGHSMNDATDFERLMAVVGRIARHSYFPGKQQAVDLCLEDIEDMSLANRITAEQAGVLREILHAAPLQAA